MDEHFQVLHFYALTLSLSQIGKLGPKKFIN